MALTEKEKIAIQVEALIKQIGVIDRFGAALAIGEACETFAGVMAETSEIWSEIEKCKDTQLKKWLEERGTHERIYAGHFTAIRDVLRLAKLVSELIEMQRDLVSDGVQGWLDEMQGKPNTDAQAVDSSKDEQLNTSEEKIENTANSEEITKTHEYYY